MYKFVCDPDALFQMALAENHRNALKMEAAAVAATNNNSTTTIPLGSITNNSTVGQIFVGNGGPNGGGNHTPQHTTALQHPQQHHSHHPRLHQNHPAIDALHGNIEDELGKCCLTLVYT